MNSSGIRFLVVNLNPTFQKTLILPNLRLNEVNRSSEYYLSLGGKGTNTGRVLRQLGETAKHLTHLGGSRREQFTAMEEADDIPLLWVESGSEIRTCTTLIDRSAGTITEIVEEPTPVSDTTPERITAAYEGALPQFDAVIIAGTSAPGYPESTIPRMVRDAKALGKLVILDIKGRDLLNSLPYGPDIIKPNFSEFISTFGSSGFQSEHSRGEDERNFAAEQMKELYRTYRTVSVITSGALPTLFFDGDGVRSLPVPNVTPVNTIGSGDAFTAGLASALGAGGSIEAAVRKGQECGALNALQILVGTIR